MMSDLNTVIRLLGIQREKLILAIRLSLILIAVALRKGLMSGSKAYYINKTLIIQQCYVQKLY